MKKFLTGRFSFIITLLNCEWLTISSLVTTGIVLGLILGGFPYPIACLDLSGADKKRFPIRDCKFDVSAIMHVQAPLTYTFYEYRVNMSSDEILPSLTYCLQDYFFKLCVVFILQSCCCIFIKNINR